VGQQPAHILGVLGIHPAQEQLGIGRGHRAQQVGGVVGIHRFEHVGSAFGFQLPQHVGLLVLRQLLEHVGETLVVEGPDHLEAPLLRQFTDRLGHLDRPLPLELFEQLGDALPRHRQTRRGQALHPLPFDDVDVPAAAEPACQRPHGDPGDQPVAGSGLLDAQVDHHDVDARELGQIGVVDAHPRLDHLTEHQHLAGPLRELAQRDVGGDQRDGTGIDGCHAADRHEDAPTGEQFHDES
jgi:hypothetical protein